MNAGDALWYLHAELTMLERRCSADPLMLELVAKMQENVNVLGEFIKVAPPPTDKKQALIEHISTNVLSYTGVPDRSDQSEEKAPPPKNNKFSNPERIEAAQTILSEMVASGVFDWASMIEDMNHKINGPDPFITDNQFRAVVNIGRRGDHGAFWEQLTDEYPEAVDIAEKAADRA